MSLTIPPGYGLAAWVFTSGQGTPPFVTTMGLDLGDVDGDFVYAASRAFACYESTIRLRTSNLLTLQKVTLSVGQDGGGASYDSTQPAAPGGIGVATAPLSLAVIAKKVTNLGGRRGRGRMFLPGTVGRDWTTAGGGLNPQDCLEPLAIRVNEFLAALSVSDPLPAIPPVLLHSDGSAPTPVEALPLAPLVGWIRGRIH